MFCMTTWDTVGAYCRGAGITDKEETNLRENLSWYNTIGYLTVLYDTDVSNFVELTLINKNIYFVVEIQNTIRRRMAMEK